MSEEKTAIIERMAKKITEQPVETKGYALMCMTAYESGKEAGIAEERQRWEKKQEAVTA